MLALLAGGTLGGFFGLLLAVPATATLKIVVGHAWRHFVLGEPLDEIEARWEAEEDARCRAGWSSASATRTSDDVEPPMDPATPAPGRISASERALSATIARAIVSRAVAGEAGPAGVGIADRQLGSLHAAAGEGLQQLGEPVAGGGIVEVDDHSRRGDDLRDRHGALAPVSPWPLVGCPPSIDHSPWRPLGIS